MNETKEDFKGKKLTEEQQKILDGLVDPDAHVKTDMAWDEGFQRRLLGSLLLDEEFLKRASRFLKPEQFTNAAHATIVRQLFDLHAKYGGLPERFAVEQEVAKAVQDKDDAVKLYYRAELNSTYEFFVPGLKARQYLMDKLTEFGLVQEAKIAMGTTLELFKQGKFDQGMANLKAGVKKAESIQHSEVKLLGWQDLEAVADQQQEDWIVQGILEASTLTLTTGLPYSGKTTLMACLMASVATGKPFLARAVKQCPVVFLNADRLRERIVRSRIAKYLRSPEDHAAIQGHFFTPDLAGIPQLITTGYLDELLEKTGAAQGLMVIDPLRTAFMSEAKSGDENDAAFMTKLLAPLRAYSRESGWCINLCHHNNKSKNEYAGSASVAANSDGLWNIIREEGSREAELSIKTRDGTLPPILVVEGPGGLTTVTEQEAEANAKADEEARQQEALAGFMSLFPETADKALSIADVMERTGENRESLRYRIAKCQRAGWHPRLEQVGKGTKTDPHRWFRC
jgi:hypothetical protein